MSFSPQRELPPLSSSLAIMSFLEILLPAAPKNFRSSDPSGLLMPPAMCTPRSSLTPDYFSFGTNVTSEISWERSLKNHFEDTSIQRLFEVGAS